MFANYSRYLAKVAIYFGNVPTLVPIENLNQYLYQLQQQYDSPSAAYFKFTVYGLRFAFKMEGMRDKYIALPTIKKDKKLPVVLSRNEVRHMVEVTKLRKHRVLLFLFYGCGLRCGETRNLKLCDLDFDRKMLHVRCGKGRKDRYVPIGKILISELKKYIREEKCLEWLFNGKPVGRAGGDFDSRYSQRGIQWAVKQTAKNAGILKLVSVHTLRHTFATHLLEDGLDIVSIKELLGHVKIETTLLYLHVAQYERKRFFSPLDTLYAIPKPDFNLSNVCPLLREKQIDNHCLMEFTSN